MSVTSIYLRSNALTAAMVGLLWLVHSSSTGLLIWILLLVPCLLAMLWWLIQCEHIEYRLLPADRGLPEPLRCPPMPSVEPLRLIGANEKPRGVQPPKPWPRGEQP